jgi:multisubunit Na+/H+ antiporter MnhC subunit
MIAWWRRHFMLAEAALALILTTAFALWVEIGSGDVEVTDLLNGNRQQVYTAIASITGALLGFVLTAISIVLGFSSFKQMTVVRQSPHYRTLYDVYLQATWFLAAATLVSLAGLIFDRDLTPAHWLMYLTVLFGSLATIRVARCVWILEQVVKLVTLRTPTDGARR